MTYFGKNSFIIDTGEYIFTNMDLEATYLPLTVQRSSSPSPLSFLLSWGHPSDS